MSDFFGADLYFILCFIDHKYIFCYLDISCKAKKRFFLFLLINQCGRKKFSVFQIFTVFTVKRV